MESQLAQGTLGREEDVSQQQRKTGKYYLLISRLDSEDAVLLLFNGTKLNQHRLGACREPKTWV